MPVKYFAPNYVSLIFPPRDNRGKKKWAIWMFAPPTAIYTHGPGLSSIFPSKIEIILIGKILANLQTYNFINFLSARIDILMK